MKRTVHQTLLLVRHGKTLWNKEQRLQGSLDQGLSKEGRQQSKALAETLVAVSIDCIVASQLKRAYQTAEIIGKKLKLPIEKDQRFNERSYGSLQGRLWPEVQRELAAKHESVELYFEPLAHFTARVIAAFTETLDRHPNQNILIVCHGGVLRILFEHLQKTSLSSADIGYEMPNASVYMFMKSKANWVKKDFQSI